MKTYPLNEKNVKLIGRTEGYGDKLLCSLSGTGFEFSFTGRKFVITVTGGTEAKNMPDNEGNCARFAVYINDERKADILMDEEEKSYGWGSDEVTSCTVRFIKLSECAMSGGLCVSLSAEGEIKPTPEKPFKIEFIGDSITCGYGVDDPVAEHHFKTATEDFTKAYAYRAAKLLDADYSAFSISGYGIISGYTTEEIPLDQLVPPYYEAVGFSHAEFVNGKKPQDIPWDFSRYVPDLIVINLGTNDASYCKSIPERCETFAAEYFNFLKIVRKNNPGAKILCSLGIMDNTLCEYVEKTAERFAAETGDKRIYTLRFSTQDGSLGYSADWHPTEATQIRASEELVAKIKEIMA